MNALNSNKFFHVSTVGKYRFRRIIYIAFFWTGIDQMVVLLNNSAVANDSLALVSRAIVVFLMSLVMGYLFVFALRGIFRNRPLWINFFFKTCILVTAAFLMTFLVFLINKMVIVKLSLPEAFENLASEMLQLKWIIRSILYWIVLFIITQLYLEINDKYSPGVFTDILAGKYIKPKVEKRIVMFIDLKDSTPIAEKLGHQQYFLFIRELIYHISMALIEHGGIIYQYVGDEIVVSWLYTRSNARKALQAVVESRKNIQRNGDRFRLKYGMIPEVRTGIHVGDVTVGEIGVIKRDLAMSGDTMNTTARLRSACNELNQKFIVSREFVDCGDLEEWQTESLGEVELKGKASALELFSLKI